MKIIIIFLMLVALISFPQNLLAHPGGHGSEGGPVELDSLEDALMLGRVHIYNLVRDKEIAETWLSTTPRSDLSNFQSRGGKRRWTLVYENASEKKASKRIIEILLTPSGKFVLYAFVDNQKTK